MRRFVWPLLVLLMMSGCCRVFGFCTSVNVHTSASSPNKFASSELHDGFDPLSSRDPQASAESVVLPGSDILNNPGFAACG
jgi:hypothetical protein